MCMADYSDGRCVILSDAYFKARKEHLCSECHRKIRIGEIYRRECTLFEGLKSTHKTCAHCQVVRHWLNFECGGFIYSQIEDDIREHATEGYGLPVIRLAVGMRRFWTTRKGALMAIPEIPETN